MHAVTSRLAPRTPLWDTCTLYPRPLGTHRLSVFVAIRALSWSQQSQHWGLGIYKADTYQEPGNAHSLF